MAAAASRVVQRALRQVVARTDLLRAGRRLVVGFSGGQDSTCLLHALAALRRELRFDLVAAHVDHALRADSGADAARVLDLARAMGVPAIARRVDVGAYRGGLKRWSIQQAARSARYQALASVVAEVGGDALAVAHTADDQAETLLLNLARGTGLAGLAGMQLEDALEPARLGPPVREVATSPFPPADRLALLRPLLRVERRTTGAYCAELGLVVVEDRSNLARAYTRNRVRLDVLPALEGVNPSIRSVLARVADLVGEDLEALDDVARERFRQLSRRVGSGCLAYERSAWSAQPRALQRRLLRLGIEALTGGLENVPSSPIEDALDLVQTGVEGRTYHLPRNVELRVLDDRVLLRIRT